MGSKSNNNEKKIDMKKFVRYPEGAKMYSMGLTKFQALAKDANACYKIGQLVLVNTQIIDGKRFRNSFIHLSNVNYSSIFN